MSLLFTTPLMKKLLSKTLSNSISGYWLPRPLVKPSPLETARKIFGITIIGESFSGAASAYHLSKILPDKAVLLLEARELAGGATGRNGGLLIVKEKLVCDLKGIPYKQPINRLRS
jgi:hypothetical protein